MFNKLVEGDIRELSHKEAGGSVTELASYPLLGIVKLLGKPENVEFYSYFDKEKKIDLYTKILLKYQSGIIPVAKVGLGVKSEGELIISGTKGYIYVPSPWWKTEYFELRFEDFAKNNEVNLLKCSFILNFFSFSSVISYLSPLLPMFLLSPFYQLFL